MHLSKLEASFLATEVDGELVMIHVDTGKFFAVRDVALSIWHALDEDGDLDSICRRLENEYAVDADTCREQVRTFANQLVEAGFAEYR